MYVLNSDEIKGDKAYCSETASKYFQKKGLPVFGREGDKIVFLLTPEFENEYEQSPNSIRDEVEIVRLEKKLWGGGAVVREN